MNTKHILDAVRRTHTAVMGMTGSGKTSTSKLLVEEAVAENFRVCILDPIKSDWWGITSSASGKSPGLPFKILGGPRGHVPLHSSAGKVIGNLVGTGKLPLSIVDMADFEAGGIQRFFVDFAESLWKSVRGVVYLVIEEAHEIAPKEIAGFGKENMAIYWAKRLATGSRTKGIRLIVASQRTQALHNAVLGSCGTLVAHRMTLDADQDQIRKWLKNTNKAMVQEVNDTLNSLPTGTAWVCSGEAQIFQKLHFPKFKTYDNTATPESDGEEVQVKQAPVNQDELRAIIGDAVKLAEANDVPSLRKRIAELERDAAKAPQIVVPDQNAIAAAAEQGFEQGKKAVMKEAQKLSLDAIGKAMAELRVLAAPLVQAIDAHAKEATKLVLDVGKNVRIDPGMTITAPAGDRLNGGTIVRVPAPHQTRKPPPLQANGSTLGGPEQRIIDSIRWWNVFGIDAPTHAQAAFLANYRHGSGTWNRYLTSLRSLQLIEPRGDLRLTSQGIDSSNPPGVVPTRDALWTAVLTKIDGPLQKILKPLLASYPDGMSHAELAAEANYAPGSGTWNRYLTSLRSLDLIEKSGELRAQAWLFP